MSLEKTLQLKGINSRYPIIQGGMGPAVSLSPLASSVSNKGCIGTLSSAALDQFVPKRIGILKWRNVDATALEIQLTKDEAEITAINIMVALHRDYETSVQGAVEGEVNMIVSGAGLPLKLPSLVKKYAGTNDHEINLVPIISSKTIFTKICRSWENQGYRPDAIILEGPKAGGHIGWSNKRIKRSKNFLEEYDLYKLLPEILESAEKYKGDNGPIPVFVAGGILTKKDIHYALSQGASGVQIGTRFAVTQESGFIESVKNLIINSNPEDIMLGDSNWGSPCMFPFRYLKNSSFAQNKQGNYFCICSGLMAAAGIDNSSLLGTKEHPSKCPEGYVVEKGKCCPAVNNVNYAPLITCGSDSYRLKDILKNKPIKIQSAKDVIDELVD